VTELLEPPSVTELFWLRATIQNAVSVAIAITGPMQNCEVGIQTAVLVVIGKNHYNAEIAFHFAAKIQFIQLNNLSNAAISSVQPHFESMDC